MEDVTRKRIMRKLEGLPEEQLYQALDYIEFLELKYARQLARKPDPFQQFAERVEDQMRVRSLAPKAMRGTMKLMSTAGRVLDGVRELGRDLVEGPRVPAAGGRATGAGGRSGGKPAVGSGGQQGAEENRGASGNASGRGVGGSSDKVPGTAPDLRVQGSRGGRDGEPEGDLGSG